MNIGFIRRPFTGVVFLAALVVLMVSKNLTLPIVFSTRTGVCQVSSQESRSRATIAPLNKQFAVFGCTLPTIKNYNYAFYLPLTALAWRRIGFKSVVIIVGKKQSWLKSPVLNYIVKSLDYLSATTVFLDSPADSAIMLSQVSRLFISSIHPFNDGDYLLTTDSDLWPFHRELYLLPEGKKILALNSKCCGKFGWKGNKYEMLPMSNIGASAATWRQIMASGNSSLPNDVTGIIEYFAQAFGDLATQKVKKGGAAWYMDQKMVSVRVTQWLEDHGQQLGYFVPRNTPKERIDRIRWNTPPIASQNDSHLLLDGYKLESWKKIRPLTAQMYGEQSREYQWAEKYVADFRQLAGTQ